MKIRSTNDLTLGAWFATRKYTEVLGFGSQGNYFVSATDKNAQKQN